MPTVGDEDLADVLEVLLVDEMGWRLGRSIRPRPVHPLDPPKPHQLCNRPSDVVVCQGSFGSKTAASISSVEP